MPRKLSAIKKKWLLFYYDYIYDYIYNTSQWNSVNVGIDTESLQKNLKRILIESFQRKRTFPRREVEKKTLNIYLIHFFLRNIFVLLSRSEYGSSSVELNPANRE